MRSLVLALTLAAAAAAHPWACFHGDPQHTGRSGSTVGAPLLRVSAYSTGGEISGSPVVRDDGAVLVGARDVKLYCFDPNLASPYWVADLTAFGTSIYFSAAALDDSGNAYITTSRKLVKVSRNGTVLWAWPGHNSLSVSHSPVIGRDGKVYFACYSDSLYALNPDSTLAWARPLGNSVNSAPAAGPDGRIYVATTRGTGGWKLWCFNPDGSSPWALDLAADADFASPAVGPDSTVYVGANRYVYAVAPGGTLKWRDSLSARIQSCPAVANDSTLYVVAGARLYCIGTDSVVRWRVSIGGSNYCSPAVDARGYVYVGSADAAASKLYCIAPDSTILDSQNLGDDLWSSPAIAGNRVYIGSMSDSLYLFTGPGQAVEERPAMDAPAVRIAPNPNHGTARLLGAGDVKRMTLYDAAGVLVARPAAGERLDLRGLGPGVYLLKLETRSGPVIQKLTIE